MRPTLVFSPLIRSPALAAWFSRAIVRCNWQSQDRQGGGCYLSRVSQCVVSRWNSSRRSRWRWWIASMVSTQLCHTPVSIAKKSVAPSSIHTQQWYRMGFHKPALSSIVSKAVTKSIKFSEIQCCYSVQESSSNIPPWLLICGPQSHRQYMSTHIIT